MKNKIFFFCLFLVSLQTISAQNIEGKVIDKLSRQALENVQIIQLPSGVETFSSRDGSFSVKVDDFPLTLRFSSIGFKTKEIEVTSESQSLLIELLPLAESLSEVVLRSTIIPQELLETPASVSVITASDLERTNQTNILDAFERTAGFYVQQGALNTNKINLRGIGARSQYSTNRLKAYFLEIPLSSGEGETTLDDIDPAIVGRTEIIKGPASSVFGAGLGGVISLYPVAPEEFGTGAKVSSSVGSYGLLRSSLQAAYGTEKGGLLATYNHLSSDGYRDNKAYERNSFTLNGSRNTGENSELSFLGQFIRLKAFIPSSLNKESFENDPGSAAFTWAAARGYESYDKGLFGISYKHSFNENFYNTTSLFMNFRNGYEPRPFDILDEEQLATGARTRFNWNQDFFSMPSRFSFGGELYREWYETSNYENLYEDFPDSGSVEGERISHNEQDRLYYNIFAQWNVELSKRWKAEAGLNFNSTSYELNDLFEEDGIDQSGDYEFPHVFSPRLGIVYSVAPGKNLYALVSHGFSTPTVAETLTPEGIINTELEPEMGVNYEVGFKGNFFNNLIYFEIAAYTIQVENLLVAERVAEDQYIGRNVGKTDHTGLEFSLNHNFPLSPAFEVKSFINASFNLFKFDEFVDEEKDFSGNELPAVPDNSIHAGFDFIVRKNIELNLSFQHEGEMALNDENSSYTDSYQLFNIKASYRPVILESITTEIFAGINNVFDEHYAASIVPNAVGFGGSQPRYYYPGRPQNYFAGLSLRYSL